MAEKMKPERLVAKKLLAALVKEGVSASKEAKSVSGEFGERVKNAVENGNLNKKAFAIALGLAKMGSEQARNQALKLIPVYIDMLREEGIFPAEHVGDLVEDAEKAAAADDEEEDEEDGDEESPAPDAPAGSPGITGEQLGEHLAKTDPGFVETLREQNDGVEKGLRAQSRKMAH